MTQSRKIGLRITAVLIGALGLPMLWYGAELAVAGGSLYYALAGLLMTASAVQLWRAERSGFYLFAALLLLTLAWAIYESGTAFWLVGSRIWLIGLLSIWLCTPLIRRPLWGEDMPKLFSLRTVQVGAAASAAVSAAQLPLASADSAPSSAWRMRPAISPPV